MSRKRDDDGIGYGRPPKHTRFHKGRSGNPKGRPRGSSSFKVLMKRILAEKVPVTENGARKRMQKREAMIKGLVNQAISGELNAAKTVLGMMADDGLPEGAQPRELEIGPDDEEVVKAFLARTLALKNGR